MHKLWSHCPAIISEALLKILEALAQDVENEKVIQACLVMGKATLEQSDTLPHGLERSVYLLHQSVPSLSISLASEVVKLCELWFTKDLPNKESVIINALIFILQKASQPSGTVSHKV